MTEASLCKKSYFGTYLRYRLGRMKGFLIVGIILNFLILPLQGLAMIIRVNRMYDLCVLQTSSTINFTAMLYITVIGVFAAIIGLVFTMVCAASSYSYFCKKETVDTLGVLAVTYRQRFWGDFLGGFIPCVGTFIPFALIGILFTSIAQNKLNIFTIDDKYVNIMPFFLVLTLTLFFAYLFIYLLTTLAAACCGRSSSMIIFSVISFAAIPILGISLTKFITLEAVGIDDTLVNQAQQLCMPVGLFFSRVPTAMGIMIDEHNQNLLKELSELEFAVNSPISVVILIVAALAILALAYFAGKSRKQENVGRMFVKTSYFHIITIIMSLGGFFIVASALRNSNPGLIIPVGLGVSLVISVIFEIVRRPHAYQLPKSAARWAVSTACGVGLMLLIKVTGSFGMINIPKDVKSLSVGFVDDHNIRYNIELTDPAEIAEFVDSHNRIIEENRDSLHRGYASDQTYAFRVTYKDKNNVKTVLAYVDNYTNDYLYRVSLPKNVMSMSFFPKKFAEMLNGEIHSAVSAVNDIFTKVAIPTDKLDEFTKTLRRDIIERHDPNAESVGTVSVTLEDSTLEYVIQTGYENTLRFIHECYDKSAKDPAADILQIYFSHNEDAGYWREITSISLSIRQRDLDNPKVKELLELIKSADADAIYDDNSPREILIQIQANNEIRYYIPDADRNRAVSLIMRIATESVE